VKLPWQASCPMTNNLAIATDAGTTMSALAHHALK
jgi:hypothetical protein